jgi:hypothetical protein
MSKHPLLQSVRKSLAQQPCNQTIYSGGHSTTNNPKLRVTLSALVERLDSEMFNYSVAKSNAIFGCSSKQMPLLI